MMLEEAISRYIRRKQATGIAFSKGCYFYRSLQKVLGNLNLRQITASDVSRFLNGSQVSATVFRVKYSMLLHLFEYWVAHGELPSPPMPANRPPQRSTFLPHIYTRDELRRLLRLASACRTANDKIHPRTLRVLVLMLYATGAMSGEIAGLTRDGVNLENGTINLPGSRRIASRLIPIGNDLHRVLLQYVRWSERGGSQSNRFFSRIDGRNIDSRAIQRNFERLRRSAAIEGFQRGTQKPCIRDLRSTFAVHQITSWIKKKKNLDVMLPALSAYLGNKGIESTERYLQLTPERFQHTLNKLSPSKSRARWLENAELLHFLVSF